MQAVEQWKLIEESLGPDWEEARLSFTVEDASAIGDAAAALAPLSPGRSGSELRFQVMRRGGGPDKLRNLLGRLDRKRIWGTLTLAESRAATPAAAAQRAGARPERQPRPELGRRAREAPARVARSPLRARVGLDRLPSARGAPRRALEPDAKTDRGRSPLSGLRGRGLRELRNVSRDGEALSRAHGRRRSHGSHERRGCAFGHGLRGDARSGLAHRRPRRLTFGVRPVGV